MYIYIIYINNKVYTWIYGIILPPSGGGERNGISHHSTLIRYTWWWHIAGDIYGCNFNTYIMLYHSHKSAQH